MFCQYCGEKIPNDSVFCPFCGGKSASEEPVKKEHNFSTLSNPYAKQILQPGFSDKINDPAIRAAMNKNRKGTGFFAVLLVLAPLVITYILGAKNGNMSLVGIGAVISTIFLICNLISAAKKKAEKQWDGTVMDKLIEKHTPKNTHDNDRDAQTQTVYVIRFRTESGKSKKLEESDVSHTYYDYLNVGDKVRYHPQFTCYYEKYDKSHDTYAICPVCGSKNDIAKDTCARCGVPVLK